MIQDYSYQKDRRGLFRAHLNVSGKYQHIPSNDDHYYPCIINNVSLGGINLTGDKSFIIGEYIKVIFYLSKEYTTLSPKEQEEQQIIVNIKVIYIRGKTLGGKFIMINKKDEDSIDKWLQKKVIAYS